MAVLQINSIRTKVLLVMVLISMMAIFFLSTALVIHKKNTAHSNLTDELSAIADVIALNTGAAIAYSDRETSLEALASLKARKGIVAAFLYDTNFDILARYVVSGVDDLSNNGNPRQATHFIRR